MKNDPFSEVLKIQIDDTSYWNEEIGKIFNYRHNYLLFDAVSELELQKGYAKIPFDKFRDKVNELHKKKDKESFKKWQELLKERNILLVSTGGTILCETDTEGFLAPILTGKDVFQKLNPYIIDTYNIIETVPFKKLSEVDHIHGLSRKGLIDSADMASRLQVVLAKHIAENIKKYKPLGVVVLHGTDTMANTAAALSLLFRELDIPIILTGSMIPAEEKKSDAFNNLKASCVFAAAAPIKPKVYVCFGDRLYEGTRTIHDRTRPSEDAFNSLVYGKEGCCGKIVRGSWVKFVPISSKPSEEGYNVLTTKEDAEKAAKSRLIKTYYSKKIMAYIHLTELFYEERTNKKAAEVIDLKETGSVMGITTYPPTKKDLKRIEKMYDIDFIEEVENIAKILKEGGVDYIPTYKERLALEGMVPLDERMGLVFRGFSGTVDERIIMPLIQRGVPIVLGSRIRFDVVSNVMRKFYKTDKELFKVGIIYSEDMVEDLLVSKLSIVLGLLKQYLEKHNRKDIVKYPEKYLYFVKLLMLINFKGEILLIGVHRKKRWAQALPECRYSIDNMAEYLCKHGFKDGDELFTERDDHTKYFYYFRKLWLQEEV